MLHHYRLHWCLHPEKDETWYERQKLRMTPEEVARELDIDYNLSTSGRVFSVFNPQKHIRYQPYKVNPHTPVYRIWDFGKTNACLFGQMDTFGRRSLFNEIILTDSNTTEQIKAVLFYSQTLGDTISFIDICDPAGSYDDGRGLSTHVELLKKEGVFPQFSKITKIPTAVRKRRAIELVLRDLQLCPGGEDAFQLFLPAQSAQGPVYLKEALLGAYAYKTDLTGNILDVIDEKHPYEDVIDCLLYWYLETSAISLIEKIAYKPYNSKKSY